MQSEAETGRFLGGEIERGTGAEAAYRVWPNLYRAFVQWSWKGATPDARAAVHQVPRDHEWAPWALFWQAMFEGRNREALADLSAASGEWIRTKAWAAPLPLFAAFAHDALGESEKARCRLAGM